MKTVSQLDENGYFVGLVIADESPLEPGVFHIPGNAVDSEPPEIPENKRAQWNDGWVLQDIPSPLFEEENVLSDNELKEIQKKQAARASALAKLEALGLTADEAQAIAGI